MTIDIEEIGRAIAHKSWRLSFPAELEALFEAETVDTRCRTLIRHNYLGLAIYNAFLVGDWFLVGDIFSVSLFLHLLVMTPIMGLVIGTIARRPPAWVRESILAGGIVLATMAILGLMLYSRSPVRSSEHVSVVLVILFATMMQRIRFPYVAVAGIVSCILYVAALAATLQNPARMGVADAVFVGVVLFSLIGCYNLEYEQRMGYLLALRDRFRNAELEMVSRRDALTGIGNRRALDHAIARRQPTGANERSEPTAVLLIDIDHFKLFNDVNGHLSGDVCLSRVAALIGADLRLGRDDVFRFGGEEFLVLLDACTLAQAVVVGERIRGAVEAAAIERGAAQAGVMTVSVGAAVGVIGREASLPDIIAAADRALYVAKSDGRNRVRCADAPLRDEVPTRRAA